jgi:hypothetical protein
MCRVSSKDRYVQTPQPVVLDLAVNNRRYVTTSIPNEAVLR